MLRMVKVSAKNAQCGAEGRQQGRGGQAEAGSAGQVTLNLYGGKFYRGATDNKGLIAIYVFLGRNRRQ